MKRRMRAGLRLLAVGLSVLTLTARGDARFHGGGRDGYDASVYVQTSYDMYDHTLYGKFKGGNKDGWAICMASGIRVRIAMGTVFVVQ